MLRTLRVSLLCLALLINQSGPATALAQGHALAPAATNPDPEIQAKIRKEPRKLSSREIKQKTGEFLAANGALMMIIDAAVEGRMEQRRVRAFNNRNFDPSKFLPTAVISNEDYGRITRVLADGTPVELEFNIVNRIYPEGKTSYNAIAEIAAAIYHLAMRDQMLPRFTPDTMPALPPARSAP